MYVCTHVCVSDIIIAHIYAGQHLIDTQSDAAMLKCVQLNPMWMLFYTAAILTTTHEWENSNSRTRSRSHDYQHTNTLATPCTSRSDSVSLLNVPPPCSCALICSFLYTSTNKEAENYVFDWVCAWTVCYNTWQKYCLHLNLHVQLRMYTYDRATYLHVPTHIGRLYTIECAQLTILLKAAQQQRRLPGGD